MQNQLYVQPDKITRDERGPLETLLGTALQGFASELRTNDFAFLISMLEAQQFRALSAVIDAAAECHFAPGSISFGWNGSISDTPDIGRTIILALELVHVDLHLFFDLILHDSFGAVEIKQIYFQGGTDSRLNRLAHALAKSTLRGVNPDRIGSSNNRRSRI